MPELTFLYDLIAYLFPFEFMQLKFMQTAMVGILLLAPMVAVMGLQVVNFRMAFFADATSHSAFTGVAIGLLLMIDPRFTMPAFALIMGLIIVVTQRRSSLSTDTIIGVFFSAVIAFGIAMVSRERGIARDMQRWLYGDILTLSDNDIYLMFLLFVVLILFQAYSYNRLLAIGMNPVLAATQKIRVAAYQYIYAALLSLLVIFSVRAVGVLLVTAMLIVPAATARNFASSAGSLVWWALLVSITSAVAGLMISAQDWASTATGATIVLVSFCWFLISLIQFLINRKKNVSRSI